MGIIIKPIVTEKMTAMGENIIVMVSALIRKQINCKLKKQLKKCTMLLLYR